MSVALAGTEWARVRRVAWIACALLRRSPQARIREHGRMLAHRYLLVWDVRSSARRAA